MRPMLIVAAILFVSPAVFAQVSCSSSVDPEICKAVSLFAPALVKAPIEIITAAEYKTRLADMDEEEVRVTVNLYPDEKDEFKAQADTSHFTTYRKHVLNQKFNPAISYIRESPSSGLVGRILVSEEAFQGFDLSKGKTDSNGVLDFPSNGKYDPLRVSEFVNFSVGYMQGTLSKEWDGGQRLDQMMRVSDERKKIHTR